MNVSLLYSILNVVQVLQIEKCMLGIGTEIFRLQNGYAGVIEVFCGCVGLVTTPKFQLGQEVLDCFINFITALFHVKVLMHFIVKA